MNEHSIIIPISEFQARIISANFSISKNDLHGGPYPQVERVRRRRKVMCWRTASNIRIYQARRAYYRALDEAAEEIFRDVDQLVLEQAGKLVESEAK